MVTSSVLSSFIFSLLSLIHSSIQSFKQQARTGKSEGTLDLWSWESSAKKWYERPEWQITVHRKCVYRVNRRGPRTEPYGTPHCRTNGVDSWPTNTDWVRQLKQKMKQSRTVPVSLDQDWPFLTQVWQEHVQNTVVKYQMTKTYLIILVTMGIISSKQSQRTGGLVGIGLSGSKLLLISSILCTKNSLNLSGRDAGEIFEATIASRCPSSDYWGRRVPENYHNL